MVRPLPLRFVQSPAPSYGRGERFASSLPDPGHKGKTIRIPLCVCVHVRACECEHFARGAWVFSAPNGFLLFLWSARRLQGLCAVQIAGRRQGLPPQRRPPGRSCWPGCALGFSVCLFALTACSLCEKAGWGGRGKTVKSSFQIFWIKLFPCYKYLRFSFNVISCHLHLLPPVVQVLSSEEECKKTCIFFALRSLISTTQYTDCAGKFNPTWLQWSAYNTFIINTVAAANVSWIWSDIW